MNIIKKMVLLFWLPPSMYWQVYLYIMLAVALYCAFKYSSMSYERIKKGDSDSSKYTLFLAFVLILLFGLRPISAWFGDMVIYRRGFITLCQTYLPFDSSHYEGEFGWIFLQDLCRTLLPVGSIDSQFQLFSFVVSVGYIGCLAWGCVRIDKRHSFILFVFSCVIFTFYTYAVNGMRNGLACSIIILALSYITDGRKGRLKAAIICMLAYTLHNSVILPAACMFLSYYFIKSPKWCVFFWLVSILISLVAGRYVESLFMGLGFDDRLETYIKGDYIKTDLRGMNVKLGFRWDFLLFSFLPLAIGWLTVMSRRMQDRIYMILLNTYILSNAFWVMVIRSASTNRFAYLSWFLYGIVMAYPLLNFKIFNQQGGVIAVLLLVQIAFTFVMM